MRIWAIALAVLVALSLTGGMGGTYHSITVECESFVTSCPPAARAGETVTVETIWVTDGYLDIYVVGAEDGEFITENEYQFTMPDNPVTVKGHMYADDFGA